MPGTVGASSAEPGSVTVTLAPPAVIASVVIMTPLTGSVSEWPAVSAASV